MRSASGPITHSKWRLDLPFANPSQSVANNLPIPPWVTGAAGFARDLKIVPAQDIDELTRFIPNMQSISLALSKVATQLGMMCHTSGQIFVIEGRGLGELAEQISAKRVTSLQVWSEVDCSKPDAVVTAVRFDKSITDFVAVPE